MSGKTCNREKVATHLSVTCLCSCLVLLDCLVGVVVKASASRAEDPGFESRLCRDFFVVESYQ